MGYLEIGVKIVRTEVGCPDQFAKGLLGISGLEVEQTQLIAGFPIFRIDLDGIAQLYYGGVPFLLFYVIQGVLIVLLLLFFLGRTGRHQRYTEKKEQEFNNSLIYDHDIDIVGMK